MSAPARVLVLPLLIATGAVNSLAQPVAGPMAAALERAVRGPEGHHLGPIGLTAGGRVIAALEPAAPALATQPRVVIVGGLDGSSDGARSVLEVVSWRLAADPPVRTRRNFQLAAVPCVFADRCDAAQVPSEEGAPPAVAAAPAGAAGVAFPPDKGYFDAPDQRETRYLWRWVTMLGPDLVIDVRQGPALEWRANALAAARVPEAAPAAADSLAGALGAANAAGLAGVPALQVSGPRAAVVDALRDFLQVKVLATPSPMRRALVQRELRAPLTVARILAARYPANPIMSYIPALSWSGALRLSALTGDRQYRDRAVAQMTPFLTGEKAAIAEPYLLTSLAGHQAFFDLAELEGNAAADALARKAADFILGETPEQIVRFATSWTDDMFMATSVLARAARRTGEARYAEAVARLLTTYAATLQRQDRVFIHARSGPHAWGRGNGFAAFGLMEALTHLPASWPARPQVLDSFRRLMDGLRRQQAPDGMWHQVVDEPGTYREFTVSAMTVAAMARGMRLGWIDASFDAVLDRGWRAVLTHVTDDGELLDVCSGTGAGRNATRDYYLNRPALIGADDRGGAMALTAALEVHALRTSR
ncbi:MAG: glycoside hydrolase family 88 protein [Vicinamibacterales bacterium]